MSSSSSESYRHDLRKFNFEVLHLFCLHDFVPEHYCTESISFSDEEVDDEDGMHRRFIMQPRWCRGCAEKRSQAITTSFKERLSVLPPKDREQAENFCIQRQYVKGVRDGRIYAIYRPLEESKRVGAQEVNDPSEYVAEMAREIEGFELGAYTDTNDTDLANMMKDVEVKRDLLLESLELAFNEMQAYEKGVKAGRGVQALLEAQALEYENFAERNIVFERTLQ